MDTCMPPSIVISIWPLRKKTNKILIWLYTVTPRVRDGHSERVKIELDYCTEGIL